MQINRFQQTPSYGRSNGGHQQNSASKSSGIQQNYATKQQQPFITTNNYVGGGGGGIKPQTRYSSVSPDSKNKSAFSEKLLANQAKRRTNPLNSNSSFTRISDKPPKDNSQIQQPQPIPSNPTCQRASSVNRYSLRTKYGANKNSPAGYSISLLKDDPFFPGQEALKKSSSLRAGSSLKCPSAGSRVQDNSKYQHNYSFSNINCTNSQSSNDTANGLTELLNRSYQNTMTCNLSNQMNSSQERIIQNRKSSTHQNSFLSMNNTGYNSSTPSTLNTQQNNQQINSQLFSYHLNPAYIDPSFTENNQQNHQGDTGASRSTYSCAGEEYNSGIVNCKENDYYLSGNYQQIHQINQEKSSFSNKKQSQSHPKQQQQQQQQYNPQSNSSLNRLQQLSNQPLKVLHTYQNMPCDIKLDMSAIQVKSTNSHYEKPQQENQFDSNSSLQKKGSGMINIPQFIHAGASTFSSTTKPNFQSTNKLNNTFNISKEFAQVSNENSQNIEDMHYYAVDFQQNCKKWLSQIELQL